MPKPTGDHVQNPNSPLRNPERLAAEFGLPYRKKKRNWKMTETGFQRASAAGKGDHRRQTTPEQDEAYREGWERIFGKKETQE